MTSAAAWLSIVRSVRELLFIFPSSLLSERNDVQEMLDSSFLVVASFPPAT